MALTESFSKTDRIVSSDDFTVALRAGHCAADGTLVVFAVPSGEQRTRIGITIPKRTGCAVVRNRWKRLIRESFRTQRGRIPTGFDFVVRPKKGAEPDWEAVKKSLPKMAQKAAKRAQA